VCGSSLANICLGRDEVRAQWAALRCGERADQMLRTQSRFGEGKSAHEPHYRVSAAANRQLPATVSPSRRQTRPLAPLRAGD